MDCKNLMETDIMEKAIRDIRWNADGLIPAIVQDIDSEEVLMLAYMNKDALRRTLREGRGVYYSRSRQALWVKGETSGHYQEVMEVRFDCDKDSLLLKVKQTGMACHENFFSCFHYGLNCQEQANPWAIIGQAMARPSSSLSRTLESLAEIIKKRNHERPEGAYTTYLFTEGIDKILKKVGEETAEVIIAAKNNSSSEIRYETADLLYHLLVLLEDRQVDLSEIADELNSRRK